jgi:hypothetical protein
MEIPFLLGIAGGAAQAELAAYRWRGAADTRIGGQAAWEQNGFAASAVAGRWFLGRKDELAARLGRNHDEVPRAPDAPLWFRFRAAGAPAGTAPAILLTSTPAADGFISRLILADRGLAPPLRGLTSLAARRGWQDLPWRPARAGRLLSTGPHDIVLAPSLDADAAIVSEGLAELGRRSGLPLVELVDGDVLVEADWHQGPIPSFRAIVGLRSAADASRLLAACAQAQGWAVDGAGYAIASPVGLISLRQDGDRLLLASTVELLDAKPRDEALPAGCSLRLSLDLPSLGRAWLPLAMDLLGRQRRRLEPGPWFWLSSLAAQGSLQTDDLRGGKPFDIYTWNGKSTIQVAALAHIFGRDNLPAQVNRGMAGYIRRTGQGTTELAIVLRSAEGFVCYASDDERWQDQGRLPGAPGAPVRMRGGKTEADWDWQAERAAHSFTRADLDQRLAGWAHLAGPGLDALPVVEIPAPVIFDRSWLPPVDAVIRNLPSRHELLLKPVTGGVVIDEEGLPLLPLLTAGQWFIHY